VDGIDFLLATDQKMFHVLTAGGRFVFFHTAMKCSNLGGRYFGIEEQFARWGREGVAAFLVQSLLMFEASPSINKVNLKEDERAALRLVPQRVVEWMRDHSMQPNFIEAYGQAAKKWESQRSFL
jgi:hypothetical protein